MPKSKSGIIKRPIMNIENINAAIFDIDKGMTIEMSAKKHLVAKTTLWRHYKKRKQQVTMAAAATTTSTMRNVDDRDTTPKQTVFSQEEEIFLAEYIKTLAQLKYDLSRSDVMKFAYLIAYKNQKLMPTTWILNGSADEQWLNGFLERHPYIPVEKADENTLQKAKECLSQLLFNQIYNYLTWNNSQTKE